MASYCLTARDTKCREGVRVASCSPRAGCLGKQYPSRRLALNTSRADAVIRTFFGVNNPFDYAAGIDAVTDLIDQSPAWAYFTIFGEKHTWLLDGPVGKLVYNGGRRLENWLKAFESGRGLSSEKPF